jgi:hypothetical protein
VERAGRDAASQAELHEPVAQLAGGLAGERQRQDVRASAVSLATRQAMRRVSTRVLPDRRGQDRQRPRLRVTARRCDSSRS